MRLLAVNPQARAIAYAVFDDSVLEYAAFIGSDSFAAAEAAWKIRDDFGWHTLKRIVSEWPRIYRAGKSKADPNDLLHVAATVGAIAAACPLVPLDLVAPSMWKGQIPKPKRAKDPYLVEMRCRAALRPDELARVVLPGNARQAWDVWDAVGIGLHALGRWAR